MDADITAINPVTAAEDDADHKTTEIGTEATAVEPTVILQITVGHTECVPIRANIAVPQRMATRRTHYAVIRCQAVRETTIDRSGRYLLIKLMQKKLNNVIYMNYYIALL